MSLPDLRPSQTPEEYGQVRRPTSAPRLTKRQALDLLAVLLIFLGAVGALAAAFSWDWRAGVALLSAGAISGGVALGRDR